jgi:RNA polymerase sigma-70 factor (ECF subfamily)
MDRVAALYRDHIAFVLRALWSLGVPEADIDDLAHDVFIIVQRKLTANEIPRAGLASKDEEQAWIYTIASLEVRNYRSRARYRQTAAMDDSTNEIPDARDEAARTVARDRLRSLLGSTTPERAAIFGLVELEGYTVVAAAGMLEITETNARRRLDLARQDIEAAEKKLAARDEDSGTKKPSAFLLPFGVGAWLKFRDLMEAPPGTAERIWERLQATMEAMEQESDRPATPLPPRKPPVSPPAKQLVQKIAGHLKGPLGNVGSALGGGGLVALLLLARPNARIAVVRIPGPVVVMSSSMAPAPLSLPAPSSPSPSTPVDATSTADATLDEEGQLLRQARAAYATGDRRKTIEAINAYDLRFPKGQFRAVVHAMRTMTAEAGR